MSTFANALKSEIARIARKELKADVSALRQAVAAQRADIVALKRELKALGAALKQTQTRRALPPPAAPRAAPRARVSGFSADKLAAHRASLGLTQAQMARLIGASALSVYKWESGKVQPRAAQLAQIAEAMKLRKRKALALLAADPAA